MAVSVNVIGAKAVAFGEALQDDFKVYQQQVLDNAKALAEASRMRGSDSNVSRKSNQYFFDFNGSFWADELGDYSFGLQTACKDMTKVAKK